MNPLFKTNWAAVCCQPQNILAMGANFPHKLNKRIVAKRMFLISIVARVVVYCLWCKCVQVVYQELRKTDLRKSVKSSNGHVCVNSATCKLTYKPCIEKKYLCLLTVHYFYFYLTVCRKQEINRRTYESHYIYFLLSRFKYQNFRLLSGNFYIWLKSQNFWHGSQNFWLGILNS